MSQHKPRLLGAVSTYINGTHSAQPAGQLITGQAERLSFVCVYMHVRVCACCRGGQRLGWVWPEYLSQGHPFLQTPMGWSDWRRN